MNGRSIFRRTAGTVGGPGGGRRRAGVLIAAAIVAAGAAVSLFGVTGASAAGAAAGQPAQGVSRASAAPGDALWVQHYDDTGLGSSASSLAVSPTGSTVYVTGTSTGTGPQSSWDYATIAYDAATGTQLWAQRYHTGTYNQASSVAVSPDGGTVFVTGRSAAGTSQPYNYDYATAAYDARTGIQLWVTRYNGPGNGDDNAESVTVSPGGNTVYVTGTSNGATSRGDYAIVAYNAATGTRQWAKRYNGPGNRTDGAASVRVSPSGTRVFVTGWSAGAGSGYDYATIAYNAATGTRQWVTRYNGPFNGNDYAASLAVSPTGSTVYATGTSAGAKSGNDYATIAYNAATGTRQWVTRYNGPFNGNDYAASLAVSPTGSTVYVTGTARPPQGVSDHEPAAEYATVAYSANAGTQLWAALYAGTTGDVPYDFGGVVGVSPANGIVFVTGDEYTAQDTGPGRSFYTTVAYSG